MKAFFFLIWVSALTSTPTHSLSRLLTFLLTLLRRLSNIFVSIAALHAKGKVNNKDRIEYNKKKTGTTRQDRADRTDLREFQMDRWCGLIGDQYRMGREGDEKREVERKTKIKGGMARKEDNFGGTEGG